MICRRLQPDGDVDHPRQESRGGGTVLYSRVYRRVASVWRKTEIMGIGDREEDGGEFGCGRLNV